MKGGRERMRERDIEWENESMMKIRILNNAVRCKLKQKGLIDRFTRKIKKKGKNKRERWIGRYII